MGDPRQVRKRFRLPIGLASAVVWGAVSGLWTPRAPATVVQALASIGISFAVGLLAGWFSRSRWAMLLAPVLFAVTVEVIRARLQGPTVDAPHLSPFGILALLVGRGFHGLLSLLPLLVGAAYGAGIARQTEPVRLNGGRVWRYLGRAGLGVLAGVVVIVAVGVALPARTPPILGTDGKPRPGSIAELTSVTVAGHRLGLMIRGANSSAPVLLFVPGPPGGSEIGGLRRHLSGLEQHFVVATVDRRGGGKSYAALEPAATLTLDGETRSLLGVTDYLRKRFRQDQIYLAAHSGGTIPATLAVQRRPEWFRAYVGAGQVVSPTDSDRTQYQDTLAWARSTGRTELVRQLTELGPPPYDNLYSYEPMLINE
ncbi:MAG TPA: alpha/beta fold hydrolase, partial [Micromonosporaceae bacterium]|nr:alpha/beta fold hydrolase [Micromonosporaceae bacterium]